MIIQILHFDLVWKPSETPRISAKVVEVHWHHTCQTWGEEDGDGEGCWVGNLGRLLEDIASWEPEGCYCCTKSMVIAPFWFSMEHLWIMIAPFWLSTDDILLSLSSALIRSNHTQRVILIKSRLEISLYVTKNRFQEVDWNQTVKISNERGMIEGLVGVLSRWYIVIAVLHILVHGVSWILKPTHTMSLDPPAPLKTLFE